MKFLIIVALLFKCATSDRAIPDFENAISKEIAQKEAEKEAKKYANDMALQSIRLMLLYEFMRGIEKHNRCVKKTKDKKNEKDHE